jgi:hypothetical protein
MRVNAKRMLSSGFALASLFVVTAERAEAQDTPPSWRITTPIRPATSPAPIAPVGLETGLTPANMATRLEQTGLPTKLVTNSEFLVTVRKESLTAQIDVSLSKGGSHVWMVLTVKGDLPSYDQISGERLARLLETNDEIGPCHFSIDRRTRALKLNLAMPNRPMSPEALRTEIEAFMEKVVATQNIWGDR